jgi:hypothetical protein
MSRSPLSRVRRSRRSVLDEQLSLALSWLGEADFVDALRRRGVIELERVRFKDNRTRMISISPDRLTMNVHACFRAAPGEVLDAVAAFACAPRGSPVYRRSIQRMREWWDGQAGAAPDPDGRGAGAAPCCATPAQRAFLSEAYARLNGAYFAGALPAGVPLRLSDRMSRRFGHVHYGRERAGSRVVEEIALNADLMLKGNEAHFLDTLLHEMAHVEAWVLHGHRGHGAVWRRIAARIGCEPAACSRVRIRRRRMRREPDRGVPQVALPELPAR